MINEKRFYVSHTNSLYKDFYLVNEFSLLEEVLEPFYDVWTVFDNLRFKEKFSLSKRYYARLLTYGSGEINSKDIIVPSNLSLLENKSLFTLITDSLCIDVILQILVRLIFLVFWNSSF